MWQAALIVLISVFSSVAPDVSGRWEGRMEYGAPQGDRPGSSIVVMLKQDGVKVTGSAGPVEDHQFPIKDGKIEGDTITFSTNPSGTAGDMQFTLKVSGGAMQGEMTEPIKNGRTPSARVSLTRIATR